MGYFNLDKTEKPDGVPCTVYRLCKELESENQESKGYSYNALLKKFHDKSGSGIIDHLKNDLHFDVNKYDDFSKCQFLKLIFKYEYENADVQGRKKYRLTEILQKPCLSNIRSVYDTETLYGGSLSALMEELESKIGKEAAEQRKKLLYQKNQRWNNALAHVFEYAYDEKKIAPENKEQTEFELNNIKRFLTDEILVKLKEPEEKDPVDDIFISFYTMLIAHEMVCEEEDRVDSYDSIEFYPIAERDYADRFTEYDNFVLRDIDQENILDGLIRNDQSEQISEFRYLIFDSDRELDQEDYSGLRLAKKTKDDFRKWIGEHKPLRLAEGEMIVSWFVAMIQEILYCKRNQVRIKNSAFGIKEGRRTLTAALKSPESAQAKEIQAWLIRLENRYCADIGSHHLQAVREIEKLFVKIRRKTLDFQLHNWKDLEFIDDALVHTVERIILPRSLAQVMLAELAGSIERATNISFVDYAGMKQQWDLGRELAYDETAITRMTDEIKMRAKDCAIDMWDGGYLYKEFIFEFPIYYSNGTESRFITKIAFHSNTLVFIFFIGIVSGEKAFQYESYGMKDLIIL
ncbi:hypothetical protein [Roseburia sp.]|uniref:hypothetical protein n=1 Tax=Roseburia sp. TaxID=2049040 RepID=UPI00352232C4